MRYFGFALIALAVLEVFSIVLMTQWIGGFATIFLMIIQFFVGSWMLRNIGLSGIFLAGSVFRSNQKGVSLYQLLWPMRYVFAAVLLLSPGFSSDIIAALLLLPIKGSGNHTANMSGTNNNSDLFKEFMRQQHHKSDDDIIEGEFTVANEQPKKPSSDDSKYLDH